MKTLQVHVDISPAKHRRCCNNCVGFHKYGVHLGYCMSKEKDMLDSERCGKFTKRTTEREDL